MSKEIMIVLVLAVAVAGVMWLEIKSRRNSRGGQ